MLSQLSYLSDRYPVPFGFAILGLTSIVPGLIMIAAALIGIDITYFIIAYAFALQFILCLSAERTIHLMLPFIVCIISFVMMDLLYFAALALDGVISRSASTLILSLGMNGGLVFVMEVIGVVASLIAYGIFIFIKSLITK